MIQDGNPLHFSCYTSFVLQPNEQKTVTCTKVKISQLVASSSIRSKPLTSSLPARLLIVRLLSGKNWHDRDKADKVSISFLATPKDN